MKYLFFFCLCLISLGGCGFYVPQIKEVWDSDIPGIKAANDPDDPKIPGEVTPGATARRAPISGNAQIEYEIKKHVYCELRRAVLTADFYGLIDHKGKILGPHEGPGLPVNWGALISLSVEADENSSVNPGLALATPMHNAITHFVGDGATSSSAVTNGLTFPFLSTPQSYTFGLGGTFSSTGTRIDKLNPYFTIEDLLDPDRAPNKVCEKDAFDNNHITPAKSSFLIDRDLELVDWLVGSIFVNALIPSSHDKPELSDFEKSCEPLKKNNKVNRVYLDCLRASYKRGGYHELEVAQILAAKASASGGGGGGSGVKQDTISLEEKFIVITSGNITPAWKLVRVSANTNTSFFGAGRTRTHDLVITIGPPNQATADAHNTLVGPSATAAANRATLGQ